MAKWLNCCGKADHLLFCNQYAALLTYSNTEGGPLLILNQRSPTGARESRVLYLHFDKLEI
jgi:hypothetical protein